MTVLLLRAASLVACVSMFGALPANVLAAERTDLAASMPVSAHSLGYVDMEQYRTALSYADAGDLDAALAIARRYDDPLFADLVLWTDVAQRDTVASFDEIAGLIRRRPDWPLRSRLLRQAEKRMPLSMPYQQAAEWFAAHPPVSDLGEVRYAEALMATGRSAEGEALLRQTWIEGDFPLEEEARIRARHGHLFSHEDNVRRLDELLWRGLHSDARRQAAMLGAGYEALADARIRLAARQAGVDDAVRRVPQHLQGDPGLLYERASWRRSRGMHDGVVELLNTAQTVANKPEKWWPIRRWAAREALDLGDPATAYRLSSVHGMSPSDGYSFAEAEWFSGWVALRFLRRPAEAAQHFDTFQKNVGTPVSLGRGAYWLGRAAEAAGDMASAEGWYRHAAEHGTTFYGQLASAKLPGVEPALPSRAPEPTAADRAAFEQRDPVRVARLLGRLGERGRLVAFLGHLSTTAATAVEAKLAADLARAVGRPSYAVHTARRLRQDGVILPEELFPVPDLRLRTHLEDALVLSIIRQESSFDEQAVSHAGARGLMQLMPGTAEQVARRLGTAHSRAQLTTDPEHNLLLGQTYLAELLDRFGGSRVLAIAAYNAGPRRVDTWIGAYGDPRSPHVDVVDWIERIPFEETRNYVQRVFEGLHVYRARLDPAQTAPIVAEELLASAASVR